MVLMLVIAFLGLRFRVLQHRISRRIWLAFVFMAIGLWTGNLVSLSLVAAWSAEGIAWQLAPGLFAIVAIAVLAPPLTKGNPYCNHLCPHGAIQQLVKPPSRSWRHLKLPHRFAKWMSFIPGVTLSLAYVAVIANPTTDLSTWEPFHAYLFHIAGWGSIALAVSSVILALFIPMGYCRLGCPTGRLLDYLRRKANSDRIQFADYVAVGLLAMALLFRWSSVAK